MNNLEPTFNSRSVKIPLFVWFLLFSSPLFAQNFVGEQYKTIIFHTDKEQIDSFMIRHQSVRIFGFYADTCFTVDYAESSIKRNCPVEKVNISYTRLPLKLVESYGTDSIPSALPSSFLLSEKIYAQKALQELNDENQPLKTEGTFEQGISAGSNGNVGFQNYLDLKISSEIAENKQLTLVLKDKQIPVQPEGTTTTLEELEEIYAQFQSPRFLIQAGDYWLKHENQLLHIQKKIKGIGWKASSGELVLENHFSKQKGQLKRISLKARTGFQGPYFLTGELNTPNTIILAGSEKITLNGQLLYRGEQNDYTIDYNNGIVYFNAQRPISAEMRIIAEYEYLSGENASAIFSSAQLQHKQSQITIAHYLTSGSKTNAAEYLSTGNAASVEQLTENLYFLPSENKVPTEYQPDKSYYIKKDTLVNGQNIPIYEYSTNLFTERFDVEFTYVGEQMGDYSEIVSGTNYRIFAWIGKGKGNYAAGRIISMPEKSQWIQVGLQQNFMSDNSLSAQILYYALDNNTLDESNSPVHKNALQLQYHDSLGQKWVLDVKLMQKQANLVAPTSLVDEEFTRNWNLGTEFFAGTWENTSAKLSYFIDSAHLHRIQISSISALAKPKALQAELNSLFSLKKLRFSEHGVYSYSMLNQQGYFFRHEHEALFPHKQLTLFHRAETEYKDNPDSIGTHGFYRQAIGISGNKLSGLGTEAYLQMRDKFLADYRSSNPLFDAYFLANKQLKNQKFYLLLNYQQEKDSLNTRNENFTYQFRHDYQAFKQIISGNYQIGLGQAAEPEKIEYYMQVPAGQGYYSWVDYNQNKLQEQGEFEKALMINDAQYLKFYKPGTELEDFTEKDYKFEFRFAGNQIEKQNFLKKFQFLGAAEYIEKKEKTKAQKAKNDLYHKQKIFSNAQYNFNRFSIAAIYDKLKLFNKYTNGGETKKMETKKIAANIKSNYLTQIELSSGLNNYETENPFYFLRNFEYRHLFMSGLVQFSAIRRIETSLILDVSKYQHKKEVFGQIQSIKLSSKAISGKNDFFASIQFLKINYLPDLSSPMAFEILQQHQNGYNLDMEIQWKRLILNDIQVSVLYQAKIHAQQILHNGTIQIAKKF